PRRGHRGRPALTIYAVSLKKLTDRMGFRAGPDQFAGIRRIVVALLATAAILPACPATSKGADDRSFDEPKSGRGFDSTKAWPTPAPSPETYRLDTGDHLHVRFYDRYDRDDLNGNHVIGESGQLRLPRIGEFEARNKTAQELERDIKKAFANK